MSSLKTRSASRYSVFGSILSELPLTELQTRLQLGRYFLSLKDSKYTSNKDIVPQVSQTLIDLWTRVRIPSQLLKNVKLKVSRLMDEAAQASKHGKEAVKTVNFMKTLHQLFDIAACQCEDLQMWHANVTETWKYHRESVNFWWTREPREKCKLVQSIERWQQLWKENKQVKIERKKEKIKKAEERG